MRTLDFSGLPLTVARIHAAIDLVDTELTAVVPASTGQSYPRGVDFATQAHNGVGWNTEIDRLHARINYAASSDGRPTPANGTRLSDHRTGSHDSSRLHDDLDRLHARVDRLKHTPGLRATKATDNTHTGTWPAVGTSIVGVAVGTYTLRLDVTADQTYQFTFNGAQSQTFGIWMAGTSVTITAGAMTLTFTVPAGSAAPGTTPGQFFEDAVIVAAA